MTRAVIFDIDGTLIDSVDLHAQAWVDAFRHFGKDEPFERVRSQIGKGGDQLLPVFLSKEEIERFGEELSHWRSEHLKREYVHKFRPFPKVRELIEKILDDGKKVGIATSANPDELEKYLEIAEIADLIKPGQTASKGDASRSKPHPDIFQAAIAKLGDIPASEMLSIGDTPYDAEASGKAGLRTVGVLCGGFPESDLRAAGCIAIYRDPADLLARYGDSPLAGGSTSPSHP